MLWLFIDMGVLWLLLNMFSDESWDDQKLKVFGIAAAISILGGIAAAYAVDFVGPFLAIGVYFLIGTVCLWGLASLSFKKALGAMGVFFGYKVATVLVLVLLFTSASSQT